MIDVAHERSSYAGFRDPILINQLAQALNATTLSRAAIDRTYEPDPRRDIDKECGYPDAVSPQEYRRLYDRWAVAARVVEVLPMESWRVQPSVYEDEDVNRETVFEGAWKDLARGLGGGVNWYQSEESYAIWEILQRLDVMSGIGSFGVLLLGLDDGRDLREPADGLDPMTGELSRSGSQRRLLYLRVFDESLVQVAKYVTDPTSPRYGQPLEYQVSFATIEAQDKQGQGLDIATRTVHWTRVVHVADNLGSSEVFGVPRLQPVLNHVLNLRKLYGSAPEMYWRGAFFGLSLETHPQLGGDVAVDVESLRDMMENYGEGLQRYLTLMGMTARPLAPTVVDPTPHIEADLNAICIKLGIPKRIFLGSERGELASSQDQTTWNDRLQERRSRYLTPRVIVPFINRLIALRVLPEPKDGYRVYWPDIDALTELEKAKVAEVKTNALAKYVAGEVDALIPPIDYLTRFLGLGEEEAQTILAGAVEGMEDNEPEPKQPEEPEA